MANGFAIHLCVNIMLNYLSDKVLLHITYLFLFSREKSAVSHSITWQNALCVKPVEISGASAFSVSGKLQSSLFSCHLASCASTPKNVF